MFLASVTRQRQDFDASLSGLSILEVEPSSLHEMKAWGGVSLFCSFWRRSIVSSNEDVNLLRHFLSVAKLLVCNSEDWPPVQAT